MAENYTVNYNINVNADTATKALTQFQTAINSLTNASAKLKTFGADVEKLAAQLNAVRINIQVDKYVIPRLNMIISKLREIDRLSKKTNTIAAKVNNSGGQAGGSYRRVPTNAKGNPIVQTTNNVGYKAFGPTPLPSSGGIAVDMMKGMGIAYGMSGLGQAISSIVEQAAGFDNTMKTVENILKSHDNKGDFANRFSSMSQTIRDVGMETKFKVTEVADAAKFLAMAGLDLETIRQSIRPIADIALVGDTDLGETADLVTNIMTAYNIDSKKMRQAADVMTNTFTMSNTTLTEIAESYKYSASLLSAAGVDFEEATAAIGVLGDAGIKGSQAGTTLRTIIANIVNPTKKQKAAWDSIGVATKDKDGNNRSLLDIFMDLNGKNLDVASFYKLFNKTAASGAAALAKHADKWNTVSIENFLSTGLSGSLADEKKNTLQGLWAQVTSVFTDTGVKVFSGIQGGLRAWMNEAIDWLKSDDALKTFKDVANSIMEIVQTVIDATKVFYSWFKPIEGLLKLWIKFQLVIWPVVKAIQALKSVWVGLSALAAFSQGIRSSCIGMKQLAVATEQATAANEAYNASTMLPGIGPKALKSNWANKKRQLVGEINTYRGQSAKLRKEANTYYANGQYKRAYNASREADKIDKQVNDLTGKRKDLRGRTGFFKSAASDVWSRVGGTVGMGVGAIGTYAAMDKLTDANSNGYDNAAGVAFGLAGMMAMAGGPVGWVGAAFTGIAGLAFNVYAAQKHLDELSKSMNKFVETNKIVDGILIDSNNKTMRALEMVWRKNYDINDLIQRRIELTSQLYGIEIAHSVTTNDVGTDVYKDVYGQLYDAAKRFTGKSESTVGNTSVETFNKQLKGTGLSIENIGGRWTLMDGGLVMSQYNEGYSNVASDISAVLQKLHGGYLVKIIEEQSKLLTQSLYSKYTTYKDIEKQQDNFQKLYDPDFNRELIKPARWEVSEEDAKHLTGEDLAKSYTAALATWRLLKPIKEARDAIQKVKMAIEHDFQLPESDIVKAMKIDPTLSNVLEGYDAGNIKKWFALQGYEDGKWVQLGNATPEQNAQMATANMQRILQALNMLDPKLKPATENLRKAAEALLLLGNGLDGTGTAVSGSMVGERKSVNGTDWIWDADKKVWLGEGGATMTPGQMGNALTKKGKSGVGAGDGITTGAGGARASDYSSHYNRNSAAPKQVIVRINNLMNVESVDLANPEKAAAIANLKGELAQALIDVVHDFDETWHG